MAMRALAIGAALLLAGAGARADPDGVARRRPTKRRLKRPSCSGVEDTMRASEEQRRRIEADIETFRADRARLNAALIDTTAKVQEAERQIAAADDRLVGPERQRRRSGPLARKSARRRRRRSGRAAAHGAQPAAGDPGAAAGHGRGDPRRDRARLDGRRTQERDRSAEAGSGATGQPQRLDRQAARRSCSALGEIWRSTRPAWARWSTRASNPCRPRSRRWRRSASATRNSPSRRPISKI